MGLREILAGWSRTRVGEKAEVRKATDSTPLVDAAPAEKPKPTLSQEFLADLERRIREQQALEEEQSRREAAKEAAKLEQERSRLEIAEQRREFERMMAAREQEADRLEAARDPEGFAARKTGYQPPADW